MYVHLYIPVCSYSHSLWKFSWMQISIELLNYSNQKYFFDYQSHKYMFDILLWLLNKSTKWDSVNLANNIENPPKQRVYFWCISIKWILTIHVFAASEDSK